MVKIFGIVILLTLFSSQVTARDYKTVFHARITSENNVADSDCNISKNEVVPISDTLAAKGWICVLLPRKLMDGVYAQAHRL